MPSNNKFFTSTNYKTMWYKDAAKTILHREDGPAIIHADGTQLWWRNGAKHRVDSPAVIGIDGSEEWWLFDKRDREDGPAVVALDGTFLEWWVNGELHREDGPALLTKSVEKWYINNLLHRLDGAAWVDNSIETYYLFGKKTSDKDIKAFTNILAAQGLKKGETIPFDVLHQIYLTNLVES